MPKNKYQKICSYGLGKMDTLLLSISCLSFVSVKIWKMILPRLKNIMNTINLRWFFNSTNTQSISHKREPRS
ncbi:unnamed protein product [Rhizophagus irregularis]|nr:unnamed protein product [Rhizophagus irregularis]